MEWGKRGDPGGEMATPAASKVVLKSTTKLSLNERFTNMLKNKQMIPANIRATMQQQHLASARNRRLAQQMESRPSVQAALKLKQSLKQRLGKSNIQARLGRPVGNLQRGGVGGMRGVGIGMRGSQRGMMRAGRGGRGMPRGAMSMRGQNLRGRGGSPRMGMGMRRGGGLRGRGMAGRGGLRGGVMNRGGPGGRGRGGVVARGRGGFSRGRGRSRGRGAPRPALTREQLDNQLDAYMSKTKGHLDAELDAYMAQADPEAND